MQSLPILRQCAAFLVSLGIATATPPTDDAAFLTYLKQHYAHANKVGIDTFLADATRDGLIRTASDRARAVRAHERTQSSRQRLGYRARGPATTAGGTAPAAVTEREYNDSQGWADAFTPLTSATSTETASGTNSVGTDYDWFSLTLPASFAATYNLSLNLAAGNFMLVNSVGSLISFGSSAASLTIPVPAGTYGIRVDQASGPYSLTYATTPYTMPTVGSTPSTLSLAAGEIKMFRVDVVGGPRRVTIQTSNPVPGTSTFGILFGGWTAGNVFSTLDSSFGAGLPGFDGVLPSGSYRVYVYEYNGLQASVDIAVTQTATTTIPSAPVGGSANGTYAGDETKLVYSLNVATASRVKFTTSAGSAPAATDTRLYVLDSNFEYLAFNDDDSATFFSRLGVALPAGAYYLVSEPYPGDTGNFVITGTALTATPAAALRAGDNSGTLLVDSSTLFSYDPRTPVPLDYTITGLDSVAVILDSAGRVLGWDDDSGSAPLSSFVGTRTGAHYVMIHQYDFLAGTCNLAVHPMMYTSPNGANRTLTFVDKVGNNIALFVSLSTNSGISLPPIQGNIVIGPAGIVAGPTFPMPVGPGTFSVAGYPNVTGVLFAQCVSVDTLALTYRMTNVID